MIKVLIWCVSDDTKYLDTALKILEQQHDGVEIVDSSTSSDIGKLTGGGGITLFLSSEQKGLAWLAQKKSA